MGRRGLVVTGILKTDEFEVRDSFATGDVLINTETKKV